MGNKVAVVILVFLVVVSCDNEITVAPRYENVFVKYHGSEGDQVGQELMPTDDGGFVIVGSSNSSETLGSDIVLIKTDALGNEEWRNTFGRDFDDIGTAVEIAADGTGYFIAGNSVNIIGNTDVLLLKVSLLGEEVNRVVLGDVNYNNEVNDVIILNNGDIMIAGSTSNISKFPKESGTADKYDYYFPKLDNNLAVITTWKGYWGFEGTDRAVSIYQDDTDNLIVLGTSDKAVESDPSKDQNNFFLRTINANETFDNGGGTFGTTESQTASDMSPTSDGGQILIGTSMSGSNTNIFIARTNRGNEQNTSFSLLKTKNTTGKAIVEAKGGGYLILGSVFRSADSDIYLVKTDSRGGVIWEKVFGGRNDDVPGDIIQLDDGSIVFTGTFTLENQQKIGLIKTNEKGELLD